LRGWQEQGDAPADRTGQKLIRKSLGN